MALSTSTTAGSYELPAIDSTYPWPRDRVGSYHGSGLALLAMPLERTQDLGRCPLQNEIGSVDCNVTVTERTVCAYHKI